MWRRGPDGLKDGSATPAQQVIYDSTEELLKALRSAGAPYREAAGRDWFDFEAPTALNYDVRITQRDVILVRNKSKVKIKKTFRGGFKEFLTVPTQAGAAAGEARLGRRRRHAGEAQVPLRDHPPRGVQRRRSPTSRCRSCSSRAARWARRSASRSSSATSTRRRARNPNERGANRDRERVLLGDRPRLPQPAAEAPHLLLRGGPALDGRQARDVDRPHPRAAEDQGPEVRHRRHQAGRRAVPVRPRGDHGHAPPEEVRIVAGRWGGRRLTTPRGTAVRPTADRVREALFSILGDAVQDARVLDLFAGSGALGLEALSRGAAAVTFVDSAAASVAAVKANLEALGGRGRGAARRRPAVPPRRTGRGSLLRSRSSRPAIPPGGAPRARAVGGVARQCWRPRRSWSARAIAGRRCPSTSRSETSAATATH